MFYNYWYYRKGNPDQAGLRRADGSVWVLDFLKERFHNTNPSDFERTFIKAGDSETKRA